MVPLLGLEPRHAFWASRLKRPLLYTIELKGQTDGYRRTSTGLEGYRPTVLSAPSTTGMITPYLQRLLHYDP